MFLFDSGDVLRRRVTYYIRTARRSTIGFEGIAEKLASSDTHARIYMQVYVRRSNENTGLNNNRVIE